MHRHGDKTLCGADLLTSGYRLTNLHTGNGRGPDMLGHGHNKLCRQGQSSIALCDDHCLLSGGWMPPVKVFNFISVNQLQQRNQAA